MDYKEITANFLKMLLTSFFDIYMKKYWNSVTVTNNGNLGMIFHISV